MSGQHDKGTWVEEMEVAGRDAVARVKSLIEQGNVRRIIVRRSNGEKIVEFPVTASVVVGGAALVFAPLFSALTVAVMFLANVRIEVIREGIAENDTPTDGNDDDDDAPRKTRIEID